MLSRRLHFCRQNCVPLLKSPLVAPKDPISILAEATERCRTEDMRTPEVIEALKTLLAIAHVRWPFEQFWRALAGDNSEGRWQEANASYNAILIAIERATSTS